MFGCNGNSEQPHPAVVETRGESGGPLNGRQVSFQRKPRATQSRGWRTLGSALNLSGRQKTSWVNGRSDWSSRAKGGGNNDLDTEIGMAHQPRLESSSPHICRGCLVTLRRKPTSVDVSLSFIYDVAWLAESKTEVESSRKVPSAKGSAEDLVSSGQRSHQSRKGSLFLLSRQSLAVP